MRTGTGKKQLRQCQRRGHVGRVVDVRVRVSKDLIFDCENANTPLHGKSIDPRFSSLSRFSSLL